MGAGSCVWQSRGTGWVDPSHQSLTAASPLSTVGAPHLRRCFCYGFATPVLGPRFPLSCGLRRAWCSRLSVLLYSCCVLGFMSDSNVCFCALPLIRQSFPGICRGCANVIQGFLPFLGGFQRSSDVFFDFFLCVRSL